MNLMPKHSLFPSPPRTQATGLILLMKRSLLGSRQQKSVCLEQCERNYYCKKWDFWINLPLCVPITWNTTENALNNFNCNLSGYMYPHNRGSLIQKFPFFYRTATGKQSLQREIPLFLSFQVPIESVKLTVTPGPYELAIDWIFSLIVVPSVLYAGYERMHTHGFPTILKRRILIQIAKLWTE